MRAARWRAEVDWLEPSGATYRPMPATFSTADHAAHLATVQGTEEVAESSGDVAKAFAAAKSTVSATYHSQYLNHAQLEPPSALARFNADGTLDMWFPNQAPDMFLAEVAKVSGLPPEKIRIHSPLLGGFFGRHFLYPKGNPYPQAIELAKRVNAPVKLIWTREEEFLRDPLRPMAAVRFRGALDAAGMPLAIEAVSATEGPGEGIADKRSGKIDPSALEGLTGKSYAVANTRIAQIFVKSPTTLAYWRSVGNSMNDFFYEAFLDELADQGGQDPYAVRQHLLAGNARLTTLLKAVVDLSGGWKRGPFKAADGTTRARGMAMASPFGTQTAAIAEVSISDGQVTVHEVWQAIDPGSIVNPAIITAQVNSAVALGVSQALVEEAAYKNGSAWRATSMAIRSSPPIACRACMCASWKAGRRWAASANRGCRRCPRPWSTRFRACVASGCGRCPSARLPDRQAGPAPSARASSCSCSRARARHNHAAP
jgi:isoquinoline 1-oxidoreductase beta subunit